jgi:hypothetical protein
MTKQEKQNSFICLIKGLSPFILLPIGFIGLVDVLIPEIYHLLNPDSITNVQFQLSLMVVMVFFVSAVILVINGKDWYEDSKEDNCYRF